MKKVKITAVRRTEYPDLMAKYENPIEHPCEVEEGMVWVSENGEASPLRGLEGVPSLPGAPQDEAGLRRKLATATWVVPQAERPRFPGPLLIKTRCPGTSSKANLWMNAQHEGVLTSPCIVRKNTQIPNTDRQVSCHPLKN